MLLKDVALVQPFQAGDGSELRELLHPDRGAAEVRYSLACAVVKPGRKTLQHRLGSAEVYYIVFGTGTMHVGDESTQVHAGHCVYIPPGEAQWIENTGRIDLAFLCIVDPPWSETNEELLE